jgi:hypothetical protein
MKQENKRVRVESSSVVFIALYFKINTTKYKSGPKKKRGINLGKNYVKHKFLGDYYPTQIRKSGKNPRSTGKYSNPLKTEKKPVISIKRDKFPKEND